VGAFQQDPRQTHIVLIEDYKMEKWKVPSVEFKTRLAGEWVKRTSEDYFKDKKVVLFSLPGAFTPTCSEKQLPEYEKQYDKFLNRGIDEIYCISVNDAFVMNAWADSQKIEKVKFIPDGSAKFTRGMGMLVEKDDKGFGYRSWRYAAIINDGVIEEFFEEPGFSDNCTSDPFVVSNAENVLLNC